MNPPASGFPFPAPPPPRRILLVTYDLKTPGRVYTDLFELLKRQGMWWHYLSNTWLIATTKTPSQVYAELAAQLISPDAILIIQVTPPYWGALPKEAWDWMYQNIGQP
jgi:hypothetical protein